MDKTWILVLVGVGLVLLVFFLLQPSLPTPILRQQIEIEEADMSQEEDLVPSADLTAAVRKVRPRLIINHGATSSALAPRSSDGLINAAAKVTPRIMFEYAATTTAWLLTGSVELTEVTAKVTPRILVEHAATSALTQNLQGSEALIAATSQVTPRVLIEHAATGEVQTPEPPPCILPCPPHP